MRNESTRKLIIAVILATVAFMPLHAFATELNLSASAKGLKINDIFEVKISLDTDQEQINAAEGALNYSKELLNIKSIRYGGSIVTFWVETPHQIAQAPTEASIETKDSQNSQNNGIKFSGIIPGGIRGNNLPVFSVIFEAQKPGNGKVFMQDATAYLNDGEGTQINLKPAELKFNISAGAAPQGSPSAQEELIKDTVPPQPFKPIITRDSSIFDGQWFLVFATQDKDSGVANYEILESISKNPERAEKKEGGEWILAQSPHLLKDQKLISYIYVKARDVDGNETTAVLPPTKKVHRFFVVYKTFVIYGIILIVLLFIYKFKRRIWRSN